MSQRKWRQTLCFLWNRDAAIRYIYLKTRVIYVWLVTCTANYGISIWNGGHGRSSLCSKGDGVFGGSIIGLLSLEGEGNNKGNTFRYGPITSLSPIIYHYYKYFRHVFPLNLHSTKIVLYRPCTAVRTVRPFVLFSYRQTWILSKFLRNCIEK